MQLALLFGNDGCESEVIDADLHDSVHTFTVAVDNGEPKTP